MLATLCVFQGEAEPLQNASLVTDDKDLKDPYCDADHPVEIKFRDISAAAYKIKGGIQHTPCTVSTQ